MRIDPAVEKTYERSRLRGGELLVTLVGTVGEVAVAPSEVAGWNVARAIGVARFPDANLATWVSYCIRSPEGQHRIGARVNTTVQTTLNLKDLREFPVVLPPQEQREAIAQILGALDHKIESNRRIADSLQNLMRAELARLTQESKCQTVAISELVHGRSEKDKSPLPDDPYVGMEHMPQFDLCLWNWGMASQSKTAARVFRPGDVLFGKIRPYFGKVATVGFSGVCSQSIEVLEPRRPEFSTLAALLLSSHEVIDFAESVSTGTTMPQVHWKSVDEYRVSIPSNDDLILFEARFRSAADLLRQLPFESLRLARLRDTLLPELLSGRLCPSEAVDFRENS